MNFEDYAKINRIMRFFEPQIVGIKIVGDKPSHAVCDSFKKDLELFKTQLQNRNVYKVVFYGDCFVEILLRNNGTPVVYYFSTGFREVENTVCEMKRICRDLDVTCSDGDPTIL